MSLLMSRQDLKCPFDSACDVEWCVLCLMNLLTEETEKTVRVH